jgi:hypothetical protein
MSWPGPGVVLLVAVLGLVEFLHDQHAVDAVLDDVVLQGLELFVEFLLVAGLLCSWGMSGPISRRTSSTVMILSSTMATMPFGKRRSSPSLRRRTRRLGLRAQADVAARRSERAGIAATRRDIMIPAGCSGR